MVNLVILANGIKADSDMDYCTYFLITISKFMTVNTLMILIMGSSI